jgi:hypothetical protein
MSNLNPEILAELRKGNTGILDSLPPIVRVQYGLALQEEQEQPKSPITDEGLAKAMLDRLKDSGVKERLTKEIEEQQNKDKATD